MIKMLRRLLDVSTFQQLPKSQRRIVFYSEGKNYWPHLEGILQEFLRISSMPVCYISSGADDPGLTLQHPNLRCYQIDEGWIRNWLFANIDTDVMVMTMPDLHQYQVKKSMHPINYVYIHHSLVSCHMVYRPGAFDHYNTIFCAGPHHVTELQAMEERYNLPRKNLIAHGYGRLDSILATQDENSTPLKNEIPHILIAPSWGEHGIIETMGEQIIELLLEHPFKVTLRPHPQTVKFAKNQILAIQKKFGSNPLFVLETNMASQDSLRQSDIMISDWSGAALDFAFGLEKPVIFIDVPKKINNPHYQEINIVPFEEKIRTQIGAVVNISELEILPHKILEMISDKNLKINFSELRMNNLFNVRSSAHQGALALLELLNDTRGSAHAVTTQ
jgi:hypothetical protein